MKQTSIFKPLILAACVIILSSCGQRGQMTPPTKSYKTMEVTLGNSNIENSYSASIRSEQFVDIRPQVTGVITDILIQEGAAIKKGQILFIIDQSPYQAALKIATANVKSAESNVATAQINAVSSKELLEENVISENEFQITQNSLLSAKAELSLMQAQEDNALNDLSYTIIKSPVDGVAGMINYRIGALVNASITAPLVSVSSSNNMYAYFSMSEAQLLSMSDENESTGSIIGQMPEVGLQLSNGAIYSGKGVIDAISGSVDRSTGAVTLRAKFENPNGRLRDGGNGSVLITNNMDNIITIPIVATYEIQNKIFVYKVVNGKANSTEITTYPYNDGKEFIVLSGLKSGDVIISEGAGFVREGTPINTPTTNGDQPYMNKPQK